MIKKHWCLPFKWGWNCILSSCPLTAVSSSLKIFSHLSTVFGSLPATGYWQHASYCYVSQQCDVTSLLVHTERMPRALWNVKSLTHVCVMEINLCGLCAAVCSLSISPAACDALCLDVWKDYSCFRPYAWKTCCAVATGTACIDSSATKLLFSML